jgi:AcrR family transcriptional regulator
MKVTTAVSAKPHVRGIRLEMVAPRREQRSPLETLDLNLVQKTNIELNSIQFSLWTKMTTTIGTRERLIRAAEQELIRSHGHLEMQAVSKRAKVSVGLAYHHFGSKAGLIAAVVEAFYSRLDEVVFKAPKSPSEGWADREKRRIASYVTFHYDHPFAPLVIGALSRAPEVLDVETAFTNRQLAGGALMLQTAQRDSVIPNHTNPDLTIALMIGGIRQALIGALMSKQRPDPGKLADEIWAFMAGALRLPPRSGAEKADVTRPPDVQRPPAKQRQR